VKVCTCAMPLVKPGANWPAGSVCTRCGLWHSVKHGSRPAPDVRRVTGNDVLKALIQTGTLDAVSVAERMVS
jgi:hypothetical protein